MNVDLKLAHSGHLAHGGSTGQGPDSPAKTCVPKGMGIVLSGLRIERISMFGKFKKSDFKLTSEEFTKAMFELKVKVDKLEASAKKSAEAFAKMEAKIMIDRIAAMLHECVERAFGPTSFSVKEDFATCTHAIRIDAINQYNFKKGHWSVTLADEFILNMEPPILFEILLEKACQYLDSQLHVLWPLSPVATMFNADDTFAGLEIMSTTSSFKYLQHKGLVAKCAMKLMPSVTGWHPKPPPFTKGGSHLESLSEGYQDSGVLLKKICPGLGKPVRLPCKCNDGLQTTVEHAIIHLNDAALHNDGSGEWTREQIADWLESLDVDLSFVDNSTN